MTDHHDDPHHYHYLNHDHDVSVYDISDLHDCIYHDHAISDHCHQIHHHDHKVLS